MRPRSDRLGVSNQEVAQRQKALGELRDRLLGAAEQHPDLEDLLLRAESTLSILESVLNQAAARVDWDSHEWGDDFCCTDCSVTFPEDHVPVGPGMDLGEQLDWPTTHREGCRLDAHDRLMAVLEPSIPQTPEGQPHRAPSPELQRAGLQDIHVELPEGLSPDELSRLMNATYGPFGQALLERSKRHVHKGRSYSSREAALSVEHAFKYQLERSQPPGTFPGDLPQTRVGTLSLLRGGDWRWVDEQAQQEQTQQEQAMHQAKTQHAAEQEPASHADV